MLKLTDPVVSQRVGLVWADGEPVIPMAGALVEIMKNLKKTGALAKVLGDLAIVRQEGNGSNGCPTGWVIDLQCRLASLPKSL